MLRTVEFFGTFVFWSGLEKYYVVISYSLKSASLNPEQIVIFGNCTLLTVSLETARLVKPSEYCLKTLLKYRK